jgi:MFS family permease
MSEAAAAAPEARPRAFAALAYRDFRLLFIGSPCMATGAWMRMTANAFQVYQITGDSRLLGVTFLFQGLPSLVMGFFGGTLADILDRRRLLQVAALGQLLLALLLAALTASGHVQVWHIYVVTFVGAALQSASNPAQQALLPSLVPKSHLMGAIALQSSAGQAAMLLGPLLGGVLVDTVGAAAAYAVDALLILPAFITLSMLRLENQPPRRKVALNLTSLFEGLAFTIRSRILIAFILLDVVTMVLGYYPAMMPVVARDVLGVGATGLGALLAAPSLGALAGFLGVMLLGNIRRKGAVIVFVVIAHSILLVLFAYSPWFVSSLLLVALLGFADSMSMSVRTTSFQLLAPEELRGRVMSVLFMSAVSANSFGGAYLGLATALLGVQHALALGGVIAGLFALGVALFWRKVWQFTA